MAISSGLKLSQAQTHSRYTQCISAFVTILQFEIFLTYLRERKDKFTLERGLCRWKGSTEKSTRVEREKMKYWSIDPCLDPSCVSFCLCNYDLKCHFSHKTQRCLFLSPAYRVFVFCLSLPESSSSQVSTTSFTITHLSHSIEQMGEKQEKEDESKAKDCIHHQEDWLPHHTSSQGVWKWQNALKVSCLLECESTN